ncbi:class I SAM-dependent methyltransferase [Candidatus Woesearchaeota archaeon]|nr:class I SAM-dependent methyltransferase [Candidatus Woesearchaeota archaeon]
MKKQTSQKKEQKREGSEEQGYYDTLWKNSWELTSSIGPSCRTRFRILLRLLKKYDVQSKKSSQEKIIDTGCGDGTLLEMLHHHNYQNLYGFDFSEEGVKKAAQRGIVTRAFWGDLTKKQTLPKEQFDAVISSEVLEHIEDYQTAVINLCRFVKPGGKLFITVPHSMKYWTVHDEFAHHCRRYERGELEELLKNNGLHVLESYTWGAFLYHIYYFFLKQGNPEKIMAKAGLVKKFAANIIYHTLKIDDLFCGVKEKKGRRLIIVAERPGEDNTNLRSTL